MAARNRPQDRAPLKPKDTPVFSKRMREFREAKGWTLYKLAQELKEKGNAITLQGLYDIEVKGADPRLVRALAIAGALGVSIQDMVQ